MRIKQQATILQKKLYEKFSFEIKHTDALNLISQTWGYDNWDHACNEKKKKDSARVEIPKPKPPAPLSPIQEYQHALHEALKKHDQWKQARSLAKVICGVYDKCNLLIHKDNPSHPLQPSFGKLMWEEFFRSIKRMSITLGDFSIKKQSEIIEENCGIYTAIEEYHSLYKVLFAGRMQPFANILLWKDPEDNDQFYQSIEEIESHINAEIAICYSITERSGASINNLADMMFFLKHEGEV